MTPLLTPQYMMRDIIILKKKTDDDLKSCPRSKSVDLDNLDPERKVETSAG